MNLIYVHHQGWEGCIVVGSGRQEAEADVGWHVNQTAGHHGLLQEKVVHHLLQRKIQTWLDSSKYTFMNFNDFAYSISWFFFF